MNLTNQLQAQTFLNKQLNERLTQNQPSPLPTAMNVSRPLARVVLDSPFRRLIVNKPRLWRTEISNSSHRRRRCAIEFVRVQNNVEFLSAVRWLGEREQLLTRTSFPVGATASGRTTTDRIGFFVVRQFSWGRDDSNAQWFHSKDYRN